ncbi:hypothetical protein TTHERM_000243659 (macronuclear) [Tetrahymena thermophila SB210]|uniref:Kinase domain protein n=1 Tax=Tetrahymena thermophila (strain SB210) TaxID=312017 RepID=W7XDV5_TETTS|nr:hypothetical protein TTHERM_000243659 [Tetrahymena thermophila SB210]EWS72056.1 hypothetical protein TTHERM_000243659 [Tetrahymena thermophila SB210]|eukprot:XP_012655367.1 hypothetical protein TTHERM_000243659 [Tetrahymena thermophila SB210]
MALPLFNVLRSVTLNFNKNQIKDSGIKTLGFQISKCYELKELKLKLEGNKITELGCLKFVENISKCTQLQEIFLSFREINLSGETSDQIFKHLEKLINLQTLSLILIECIIKDIDVQKLANCLKYLTFLTSLNLNLSQNLITSEGILALGEVISQQQIINQLKLYLCNNPITAESLNELYKKICSLKNLEKLIIDQSKIQFASDQEIQIFQETLSNTNKIQYLYIKITGLENRSTFINMMKSLQNCQCLDHAEFIFSDNKIQDEDLIIFGESLSKLQSLSSLTLMIDNNKIQTGILEFLTLLHYCGKLSEITLDLSQNIKFISNQNIKNQFYSFNRLSQDTIYKLSKSIRKFQKILSVFILIQQIFIYQQCDFQKCFQNYTKK